MNGKPNNSMDVRAKQLLSFYVVRYFSAGLAAVSPHVISAVGRLSLTAERIPMIQAKCKTITFSLMLFLAAALMSLFLLPQNGHAQNTPRLLPKFAAERLANEFQSWDLSKTSIACLGVKSPERLKRQNVAPPTTPNISTSSEKFSTPTETPQEILARRPFRPNDILMYPFPYLGYRFQPSTNPPITDAQGEALLQQYAQTDPFVNAQQALLIYRDPAFRAKIGHPSLGVALAAASFYPGGRAALDYILNARTPGNLPKVAGIAFGQPASGLVAQAIINNSTNQVMYIFNQRYIGENSFLFVSAMLHEVFHQDALVGRQEEMVAYTFQYLAYLLQIQYHPDLALQQTELAQLQNELALGLFNSGQGFHLGILSGNGSVFPNSTTFPQTNFAALFSNMSSANTPRNDLVHYYLNELLRTIPRRRIICSADFNEALLQCLDRELIKTSRNNFSYFSPQNRVQMATAMNLNTSGN